MIFKLYSPNNRYIVTIGEEFKFTDLESGLFREIAYPVNIEFACFTEDSRFLAMKNNIGCLMVYDINNDEIVFDKTLSIITGRSMWFAKPAPNPEMVDWRTQVLRIELKNRDQVEFNWKIHVLDGNGDSKLKRELLQQKTKDIMKLVACLSENTIIKAPELLLEAPKRIIHGTTIRSTYISPDSRYMFVAGRYVSIYDFENGEKIGCDIDAIMCPSEIAFSNNGKLIAIKNPSGQIAVVDIMARDVVCRVEFANVVGCGICFTPDDRYIVTWDWYSHIIYLDVKSSTHTLINVKDFARDTANLRITGMQKIEDTFIFYCEGVLGSFVHICCKYPFDLYEPELIMGDSPKYVAENGSTYDCVCKAKCANTNKEAHISTINRKLVICDEYRNVIATPLEAYETLIPFYNSNGWSTEGNYYVAMVEAENEQAKIKYVNVYETESWTLIKRYEAGTFLCFAEFSSDGNHLIIGTWEKGFVINVAEILT